MTDKRLYIENMIYRICPGFLKVYLDRLFNSPPGNRMARGVFWTLTGTVISRGLGLAASVLVARMLGNTGFGELGIIRSTLGMFGILGGLGLGITAMKHTAEFRNTDPQKAGRVLGFSRLVAVFSGSAATVALFIFAPWLAANVLAAPHLGDLLRAGAGLLFLNAVNGEQTGALSGFEAFRTIARVNLFAGLSHFPLMVGGVYLYGLGGAVAGLILTRVLHCVLNYNALRTEERKAGVPHTYRGCTRERHILWNFSLPLVLTGLLYSPVIWACNTMLVNQPGGYAEMGIFNAVNHWRMFVLFLPAHLNAVSLPILTDLFARGSREEFFKMIRYNFVFNSIVVLVLAVTLSAFSPFILELYGPGYEGGVLTFVIIMLTTVFIQAASLAGIVNQTVNAVWWWFALTFVWAVAMLICTYYFVQYGAEGLALAYAVSFFIFAVVSAVYLYTRFRIAFSRNDSLYNNY